MEGINQIETLRSPGYFERYNIARNHNRFYNNVGITASYEISEKFLRENGLQALTFAALRRIIDRHPVMSVTILDEGSLNPSWVRLQEIDLKEVVQFKCLEEHETGGIIEAEHQLPFERLGELPLWRVVLIESQASSNDQTATGTKTVQVGFFWHHGIGDGGSGIAFHLEFLDALNTIAMGTDVHPLSVETIVIPPKVDLLPSLEEALPIPLSAFFLLKQLFKLILPSNTDNLLWTGPPLRSENNITHLRTLFLPDSVVQALLRLCRENNVTLTSLLVVVIARILATTYPDYRRFKCKTAMSLRRFTKADKRSMVSYVSSISHCFSSTPKAGYINCGGKFSWNAVKACKLDIDAATASPKNQGIALLKYLKDYGTWLQGLIGLKRQESFEVSNLGVIDGGLNDQNKAIKLKRILFSQSSNAVGPAYVFNVATVKGGELGIGLTWQDGILDVEVAEKVLARLGAELRSLGKCQ